MKTKTSKWLAVAVVFCLTASCAVYEGGKTTINYSDSSNQSTTIIQASDDKPDSITPVDIAASSTVTTVAKKDVKIKIVKVGCNKFVPPTRQQEPTISDDDLASIRKDSEKAVIGILLTHIRKVHNYNLDYEHNLEEALTKHYKTCNRN